MRSGVEAMVQSLVSGGRRYRRCSIWALARWRDQTDRQGWTSRQGEKGRGRQYGVDCTRQVVYSVSASDLSNWYCRPGGPVIAPGSWHGSEPAQTFIPTSCDWAHVASDDTSQKS